MVRYVTPVSRRAAESTVASVYEAIEQEFGVHADAFTSHSPVPEILAGVWMLYRETLVADGLVDRAAKEAVATAVSSVNRCSYCVDAHAAVLAAGGKIDVARQIVRDDQVDDPELARVVEWAAATRSPDAPILRDPPFDAIQAPELVSAALTFHYMNRPVSVFCGDTPFPLGRGVLWGPQLRLAGRRFRPFFKAAKPAGSSLSLLPEGEVPGEFSWARESPALAGAWSRFASAVERAGKDALPAGVRARVVTWLGSWRGQDPDLGSAWISEALDGLPREEQPAGLLALLAAVVPHRVGPDVMASYREGRTDGDVVAAVAWSALAAVRRIASWTV